MNQLWLLWPLLTLFAGLLALAPLGVQVLRRKVVFIDLAVSQAAAAGVLGMQAVHHTHRVEVIMLAALSGALVAAFLVAYLTRRFPEQREALVGLVYVASAMLAVLSVHRNPHGAEDLQSLLSADLLWSSASDTALLSACALLCLGLRYWRRNWFESDRGFYLLFALIASVAVQRLGVFLVFAMLIAPAVLRARGHSTPLTTVLTCTSLGLGLAASWLFDLPSGASIAWTLAVAAILGCVFHRKISAQTVPP